jgi:hypothetical protein
MADQLEKQLRKMCTVLPWTGSSRRRAAQRRWCDEHDGGKEDVDGDDDGDNDDKNDDGDKETRTTRTAETTTEEILSQVQRTLRGDVLLALRSVVEVAEGDDPFR